MALLADPARPACVVVFKGAPAIVGLAIVGILLAWGAWLSCRLDRLGLILTFGVLALLRVSTAVYLWSGGSVADLMPDAETARLLMRMQQLGVPPTWVPATTASIEAAAIIARGLFVSRYAAKPSRFGVLHHGSPPSASQAGA